MYILFIIDDDDLFRESIRVRIEGDVVRLVFGAKLWMK
jgi:hypothetical protein